MGFSVITGGAGGMGIELAKLEGKTRDLVLVDVSQERLDAVVADLAADGIKAEAMVCDLSKRENVDELAAKIGSREGLEAVYHTAGLGAHCDAEPICKVNGFSVYWMTEAFLPIMPEGSSFLTVSSLSTHIMKNMFPEEVVAMLDHPEAPDFEENFIKAVMGMAEKSGRPAGGGAYGLSKLFTWRWTRRNVQRFANKGVRLNTVTPGVIETPMSTNENPESMERTVAGMAMPRWAKPVEMASLMCYLGSPMAANITGVDFALDGGFTCKLEFPDQVE